MNIQITDTEYIAPEGYVMTQAADVEPAERVYCTRRTMLPGDKPEDWQLLTASEAEELKTEN